MIEAIRTQIAPFAKLVAAVLTPIVIAIVRNMLDRAGLSVDFDEAEVNRMIDVAITAFMVWLIPNASPETDDD